MTATTETPAYHCRNQACRREIPTLGGHCEGYCSACSVRWRRAGKPEGGPPAARFPGRGHGRITKAEAAERMERFSALRAQGLTVAAIAEEMDVSLTAAEHYAAIYRQQVRDGIAEAPIDWPVPASPLPGVSHWSGAAACRGNWDLFYAPDGPEAQRAKEIRDAKAKSLCAACQVREECRAEAASGPGRSGTWAGVSEDDRERNKKQRAAEIRADRDRRNAAARREQGAEVAA